MRVLYVSQYYLPETGAPAVRVSQMAQAWRALGDDVRVLTGFPNHPGGRVYPGYRAAICRGFQRCCYEGVPVYRTWLWPSANRGTVRRCLNYASFAASAAVVGNVLPFRPDVVVGTSPQLLCALAAEIIARVRRLPFIFEVRDLWPESLLAVDAAGARSALYKSLDRVARYLYARATAITVVSPAFVEPLIRRGIPAEKIKLVPAGYSPAHFHPRVEPLPRSALGACASEFLVSYVGTIGMAHGIATILDAAEKLKEQRAIKFAVIGNGAEREAIARNIQSRGLNNVALIGPKPWREIPGVIATSDACIVPLKDTPLFRTVIPTKMLEIMGVGRPVILAVAGHAATIVERAEAGVAITPESADDLVRAIAYLRANPNVAAAMGAQGGRYAVAHHGFPELAAKFAEVANWTVRQRGFAGASAAGAGQCASVDERG